MYEQYARSARVTPQTVDLGCHGAKGHWIGNKNAKHVLVWYHGGGFCLPANAGYFKFWADVVASSRAAGKDVAVFALTYTLAPHARYPTQLTQAVEALRYVLDQKRHRPSQIFLGGDSAGGNLAVGVLSHLAHPHPAIKELKLEEPLAGTAVIAPWTSLDENHSQEKVYSGGDLITPFVGKPWSRHYLNGTARDYYTDASLAPSSWFETYPVKQILVLGGGNEVLLPIIEDFVEKLKVSHGPPTDPFEAQCTPKAMPTDTILGRFSVRRVLRRQARGPCRSRVQPLCWGLNRDATGQEAQGVVAGSFVDRSL